MKIKLTQPNLVGASAELGNFFNELSLVKFSSKVYFIHPYPDHTQKAYTKLYLALTYTVHYIFHPLSHIFIYTELLQTFLYQSSLQLRFTLFFREKKRCTNNIALQKSWRNEVIEGNPYKNL